VEGAASNVSTAAIFDGIAVGAVEFDGPGITCPGAFEHSFPWCPTELIDAVRVRWRRS
jgi:hypothetical protein